MRRTGYFLSKDETSPLLAHAPADQRGHQSYSHMQPEDDLIGLDRRCQLFQPLL
jgi:hypothetical protein